MPLIRIGRENLFSILGFISDMSHLEQFFSTSVIVKDERLQLHGDEFRHATHVKRKKVGDRLAVLDGDGHRYSGVIEKIDKEKLTLKITNHETDVNEPTFNLILAVAVAKGSQFDWLIEKGTEIGVSRFVPLLTEYTQIDPVNRMSRWQKKAISALKQSARSRLPIISEPVAFRTFVSASPEMVLLAHPCDDKAGQDMGQLIGVAGRLWFVLARKVVSVLMNSNWPNNTVRSLLIWVTGGCAMKLRHWF